MLLEIIGNSFSGENPHRAAAMELIFERSIQEHRERVVASAESKIQSQPAKTSIRENFGTAKPTPVSEEKLTTVIPASVLEGGLATVKAAPVKIAKKQSPIPDPVTRPGKTGLSLSDFFNG